MWQLLSGCFGAVPRTLLWDNEPGIGRHGRLAEGVAGFCGVLGTRLIKARPYDPETKALVERANGYLQTSFMPGRRFVSAHDFNTQVADWLAQVANSRKHATTRMIPAHAVSTDRQAMATLPPVAPTTGTTMTTRLGRDYYASIGGNAYSVHPEASGRMITVTASLDQVVARCADRVVANHERLWGTAGLASDPEHVAAASIMREKFWNRPVAGAHLDVEVQVADLGADDAVFGPGEVACWPPNAPLLPVTPTS